MKRRYPIKISLKEKKRKNLKQETKPERKKTMKGNEY